MIVILLLLQGRMKYCLRNKCPKGYALYQDFLSNLIAMDLLGNANNYTASADVITLIKMDQAYKLCYVFSYSASSEYSGITHLLVAMMMARFDHSLLTNNLSI